MFYFVYFFNEDVDGWTKIGVTYGWSSKSTTLSNLARIGSSAWHGVVALLPRMLMDIAFSLMERVEID